MSQSPEITIVDYGVGNLQSLVRAVAKCGAQPHVSEEPKDIESGSALILPGVGAFVAGMRGLQIRGLIPALYMAVERSIPMLGICLGAQLLLTEGHEFGIFKGLDIIPGRVVHFPPLPERDKVPHIGWNAIQPAELGWAGTPLAITPSGSQVYFVHSYILEPVAEEAVLAITTYGGVTFCSAVRRGSIFGCQFHPEKSGPVGLGIIKEFIILAQKYASQT